MSLKHRRVISLFSLAMALIGGASWLAGCEDQPGLNPLAVQMVQLTSGQGTGASASLAVGQSLKLNAIATGADGNPVNLAPSQFQWTSSNPAAATVDAVGNVTAISPGSTQITANEKDSIVVSMPFTITVTPGGQVSGSTGQTTR